MRRQRTGREWAAQRRRQAAQPTPRTATIARLIAAAVEATGQAPTDDALARLLAISPERVRHHRRLLGV